MLSRSIIQHIKSLQQKKFREKSGEFIVEGPKLVDELLKSNFIVKRILATEDWFANMPVLKNTDFEKIAVTPKELERISSLKTPNRVLALVEIPKNSTEPLVLSDDFYLMLDGLHDPGNLGTIIRSADWYGISKIVCSEDTVEFVNPKVVQATMGSIFRVEIFYTDLEACLDKLEPDFPVYGTFMDGKNIYTESFAEKGVIIIGSESHGISPLIERKVKIRLNIPTNNSMAESLIASVAAAICCSEIKRSHLKKI